MDSFINLAKQGYSAYEASQSHNSNPVSQTGGSKYNSPDNSDNSNRHDGPEFDHDEVASQAAAQHGSDDPSIYRSALKHISENRNEHGNAIDEGEAERAHHEAYNQERGSNLSAQAMGGAAAMQALKSFTSGGGGGGKSELISLAMSEASKLFDKSGGAASGNKQDVVNGAAMTVMKLVVQSKASSFIGGGNSGGMGSLMGLASKLL